MVGRDAGADQAIGDGQAVDDVDPDLLAEQLLARLGGVIARRTRTDDRDMPHPALLLSAAAEALGGGGQAGLGAPSMSSIEWIAAALGVACIVLLVRRSLWNYPFAIVSVALLGWVFLASRLYTDAMLQVFFVVINLYGWIIWPRSARRRARWSSSGWLAGARRVAGGRGGGGGRMGCANASLHRCVLPVVGCAVAMASVAAQMLLVAAPGRELVAVDRGRLACDAALRAPRVCGLTAALYVIYLGLSVWGLPTGARRAARAGRVA